MIAFGTDGGGGLIELGSCDVIVRSSQLQQGCRRMIAALEQARDALSPIDPSGDLRQGVSRPCEVVRISAEGPIALSGTQRGRAFPVTLASVALVLGRGERKALREFVVDQQGRPPVDAGEASGTHLSLWSDRWTPEQSDITIWAVGDER